MQAAKHITLHTGAKMPKIGLGTLMLTDKELIVKAGKFLRKFPRLKMDFNR